MEILLWWLGSVAAGLALGYLTGKPKPGALWPLILGPIGLAIFIGLATWTAIKTPKSQAPPQMQRD